MGMVLKRILQRPAVWMLGILFVVTGIYFGLRPAAVFDRSEATDLLALPRLPSGMSLVLSSDELWPQVPLTTLVFADSESSFWVLFIDRPVSAADLSIYGVSSSSPDTSKLPEDSIQLTRLLNTAGGRFQLSLDQLNEFNRLLIYSPLRGQIIADIPRPSWQLD